MIDVPDFAEPLEAWRVWRVVGDTAGELSLRSVVQPTLWPPGEVLEAECLRCRGLWARLARRAPHCAPEPSCECGIYAASLQYVGRYLNSFPARRGAQHVLGRVSLWGTVVECERGFRASRAYPSRIYLPVDAATAREGGWDEIAFGLWRYEVPIEPLASSAADAVRMLAERHAA